MSSRVFQGVILQLKEASGRTLGVVDSEGMVVACSELRRMGERWEDSAVSGLPAGGDHCAVFDGFTFKPLQSWQSRFEFAVFVEGADEAARTLCQMAAVTLNAAKSYYDEKHDKSTFIKNILLDNILPGDIYIRSKELHFDSEVPRVVFLVRQNGSGDLAAVDVVAALFPDRQHDFVIGVGEHDVALVKDVTSGSDPAALRRMARGIEDTVNAELSQKTVIGIGTIVSHLKDLASSYKAAQVAIEVGEVFDAEKTVIAYETLGLGRLIYQLPVTLCDMFLTEVFKKNSIDSLDQETLSTIQSFFENNLNVSETSRKLYVHRNTLVYRLEKIKKLTGLDLREFDHAIVFKVALMVKRYLNSQQGHYLD